MVLASDDETAGALEPFQDAALYDWEYRRRRADVAFYRALAGERGGPILDLACGTGRLMVPLLRDGHVVAGVDHAPAMLARAAARLARLRPALRRRALLVRGDLRRLPVRRRPRFGLAVAAFHSVQHLGTDAELVRFFASARAALIPGGWLVFDVFVPSPAYLARATDRRWDRTAFRHPVTGQRLIYTSTHRLDDRRRKLLMTFHYQPVDGRGRARGPERHVRLVHRQLAPEKVGALLRRAGLVLLQTWAGFDWSLLADANGDTEQHIYLAKRPHSSKPAWSKTDGRSARTKSP